jgi:hypothetical protein
LPSCLLHCKISSLANPPKENVHVALRYIHPPPPATAAGVAEPLFSGARTAPSKKICFSGSVRFIFFAPCATLEAAFYPAPSLSERSVVVSDIHHVNIK